MARKIGFKALGKKGTSYTGLETFTRPKRCAVVKLSTDEVTAVCPVTSQPDWYKVDVTYHPTKVCIESKSFKLFMHSLRERGMFCEALADYILQEVLDATRAAYVEVTVTQKPRGGVSIVSMSHTQEGER